MKYLLIALLPVLLLTCEKNDPAPTLPACGPAITITPAAPQSDGFALTNASVDGFCLTLTVAATGCGSDSWTAELLTDGVVAESSPTQTSARLVLNLNQGPIVCQAEFEKDFTFDLTDYLTGALPTRLRLEDTETVLEVR